MHKGEDQLTKRQYVHGSTNTTTTTTTTATSTITTTLTTRFI